MLRTRLGTSHQLVSNIEMKRVGLSIGTGSFVFVTDVIPKRLSKVYLVNEVTVSGHDARLCCYGGEDDDKLIWQRVGENKNDILGIWYPIRGKVTISTLSDRYFFDGNWPRTLSIKEAVTADAGIYRCFTELGSLSYGHLTILSKYAM